jgi:hypothetical protein
MTKKTYTLVNPIIKGTFKDTYDGNTPINAANKLWKGLTEHILGDVKLHHFNVVENKNNGSYNITKTDVTSSKKDFDTFFNNVNDYENLQQEGGKPKKRKSKKKRNKSDNSLSDSDSDSDDYGKGSQVIRYPVLLYNRPICKVHYNRSLACCRETIRNPQLAVVRVPVFVPVFRPVLKAYIAIW